MVKKILISSLCLFLAHAGSIKQNLANNIVSHSHEDHQHGGGMYVTSNQEKIWREMIEPEENEFLFNGMNVENKEVFRLREIRKRNKKNLMNISDVQMDDSNQKSNKPANKETLQLTNQIGLGLQIQTTQKSGQMFIEVLSQSDDQLGIQSGLLEDEIKGLQDKKNSTDSYESHAALTAAISYLQASNQTNKKQIQKQDSWGILTYFYNDGKCDYEKSESLTAGQTLYRARKNDDTAAIFVANGELTRSKGDQVGIEVCQGKALQDGNMKVKTYGDENIYVVNHENNSIYNDVSKFPKNKVEDAMKEFNKYPKEDTTILVQGNNMKVLQQKGEDIYVGQNLAYLYNDPENKGEMHEYTMQALIQSTE